MERKTVCNEIVKRVVGCRMPREPEFWSFGMRPKNARRSPRKPSEAEIVLVAALMDCVDQLRQELKRIVDNLIDLIG